MLTDLTAEHVRSLFTYDPEEGLLRWRFPAGQGGRILEGSPAGWNHPEGYRIVRVNGRAYRVARIVWLYVSGEWPRHKIDHKDCNPSNDKWNNLREATDSEQKQNNRKRKDNKTGYKCVSYYNDPRYRDGRCYRWQVVVNGKRIKSSKRYATAEECYAAYCELLPRFHGEFANYGA